MSEANPADEVNAAIERIAEQCVAVRLRLLTRAVNKIYNRALRPHGLTISQMNILVAVSCLKEAKQQDICRALHLERSTLSRDLERLRAQGWLDKRIGADERTSLIRLTREGRRLLQQTIPAWEAAQEEATRLLGAEHVTRLERTTRGLRARPKP
jgi:DNA-binding MarR family transcriptional regulator